ncbi:stage II sporulation protein M [Paenibacillus chitinolyticus]|uniref:stage II sporulation protein M n=1 Tax=Paenibacillus chitinolyticus TaxID=79263 RepID=UPI002DB6DBCB|nr:stage II sporulation protein M [Paenibacillus chitinolyticus]MEC0245168.1 stage II sporulation protein M [Paenibacillus chitinolyticus]
MLIGVWKQEKKRLLVSSALLFIGIVLGISLGSQVNVNPGLYYRPEQEAVWYALAVNNIGTAFIVAASGILLSIPTVLMLLFNGLMIGFVIILSSAVHSWPVILAGLLPHAILEIPALLLAGAIGMRPLGLFARAIRLKQKISWKKEALDSAKLFAIVTVLLIAASLIEANLTPVMMNWAR